jgi:regulator of sigma E protease
VPVLSNLVGAVEPESPAAQAGIQKGDRIVAVDGQAVTAWDDLSNAIKQSGGQPLSLRLQRGGQEVAMTVQPRKREVKNIFGELKEDWMIGIGSQVSIEKGDPGLAVSKAFVQTYEYSKLTLIGLYKMITREVSPRNLGGPILIAQMAGQQAQEGIGSFLAFLAVLSINLGVLNLLPVPVLDGGHLFFFAVEAIIGRPVSLKYREKAQQVGIFLLLLLMIFAFANDIFRLFEKPVGG